MTKIIIVLFFTITLHGKSCKNEFNYLPDEIKQFSRILYHIKEHHSTCNIVYAYNLFLDNPVAMNEIENDNIYAENLGKFAKNYPYFSEFILNKNIFLIYDNYTIFDKESINQAIKQSFATKEIANIKNIIYLQVALVISNKPYKSLQLVKIIKSLKKKYNIEVLAKC